MYNFRDTTTSNLVDPLLPAEAMNWGGEFLENIIPGYRTLAVDGREVAITEYTTSEISAFDGSQLITKKNSARIITVYYQLIADSVKSFRDSFNELNRVLNKKENILYFNDEPDKYFKGIKTNAMQVPTGLNAITSSYEIYCPDPYKYSNSSSTFLASLNSENVLAMEVTNNGADDAELSFDATMTSDNGFLGVVGPLGAFEVGNAAEVDGHTYQRTDVVAKNHLRPSDEQNWELNSTKAKTYYPIAVSGIPNRFGEGSFNWTAGSEGPTPVFPNNPNECWVGPTLYRDIPVNSNGENTGNFEAMWRCNFKTQTPKESIREEFNLVNGDQVVAAIVLRDSSNTKTEAKFELMCYTPEGTKYYQGGSIDLKKATGSWFDVRVSRVGSAITFRLTQIRKLGTNDNVAQYNWQYQKKFTVAEMADVPITGTTYWPHAKWNNSAVPKLNSKGESITNFVFRWINVDKWADDPNRYSADDVLHYDGTTGKFYVNQLLAMNDIIQGSVDLRIPPGTWYVEFYYSDFAETPIVTGTLRERWL